MASAGDFVRASDLESINAPTPRFAARITSDSAISTATTTNLSFATNFSAPYHDVGSPAFIALNVVGGEPRYQAEESGLYHVAAEVQWNANATGTRKLHIYFGADTTPLFSDEVENAGAGSGVHQQVIGVVPLNAGEYFRVAVYQASGSSITIIAAGGTSGGGFAPSKLVVYPVGAYDF